MRRTHRMAIGLLAGCGCLATAVPAPAASLPRWARELAVSSVSERYADEEALVLFDEWTIQSKEGERSGRHRTLTRVLTEEGSKHAVFSLARGVFDRFSGLKLWIAEPSGRVTRYREDEGLLFSAASRRRLDETEVIIVSPPGLAPGAVVAVEYDWVSSPDIPQDWIPVQKRIPVVLARIELRLGEGWQARARVSSSEGLRSDTVRGDRTWEFRDIPALRAPEQEGAPEPSRSSVAIDYAPVGGAYRFDDWGSTADWAVDLFDQSGQEQPLLSAAIEELRSDDGDPVERVGAFVRSLRYFAVSIGWGGIRPRPPELTLERGFGDCKDKSLLMVALLRELGAPATPVLTTALEHSHVHPGLSSPRQFNHCVVGIPWAGREARPGVAVVDDPLHGPMRIYDPTLSVDSAQDISTHLEGAPGLPVDRNTTGLVYFPRSGSGENLAEITMLWNLDATGGARFAASHLLRGTMRGSLEDAAGSILSAEKLRRQRYEGLSRAFPGLEDLEIHEPHTPPDGDWYYDLTFRHQAPLQEFAELRVLRPMPLRSLQEFPLPDDVDGVALHQQFLATYRRIDKVVLDGQTAIQVPAEFEVSNALGRVGMAIEEQPDRLRLTRELEITSATIDPGQRTQVMELRAALRRANQAAVVLEPAHSAGDAGKQSRGGNDGPGHAEGRQGEASGAGTRR